MIDAHLHIGRDLVYDGADTTEDMLLRILESCRLDGCVVYPGNSNISKEVERKQNGEVETLFRKYPERFFGICQVNPNYEREEYLEEISDYKRRGFRGINVNPQIHGWDPLSHHGEVVFSAAEEAGMPLFINVGIGLPLGQPVRLIGLCQKYEDVPVVLVHASKSYCGSQCDVVARECPNVYLETSLGPNMRLLKKYVGSYGAHRVIMGSCYPEHVEHSLYCLEHCGISSEEMDWVGRKTILRVFGEERGTESC